MIQDNLILEHYGLNELNFETIKSYRDKFAEVKPDHPWNVLETKEFLYKIGAWGKARDTHREGVTLAGLLLFSEERMITEVLPQYFLEYRESDGEGSWKERFTSQDGTWSGNLYDFYFYVTNRLTNEESNEEIASSLIEALTNMLLHADYNGEGGLTIEYDQHQCVFSNPGLFRIPVDKVFITKMSNLRNPHLFKLFRLLNLCERSGSGLTALYDKWNAYRFEQPQIDQDVYLKRTLVILPLSSAERQTEYTDQDYYESKAVSSLGNNQEDVENKEKFVEKESSYNKEKEALNIGVEPLLKELECFNTGVKDAIKGDSSCNIDNNSYNKEVYSYNNVNPSKLDEKEKDSLLWDLSEIARRKKRLSPAKMEEIIMSLCREQPLMLKDLAYLLERTPDGVRNNYLSKMLRKGKLQLKYPDQPNHPKQAYLIATQRTEE
ncbi:ATP-binding protein [Priestia flexa]|uniref:ATP-binding protein n=1 Tax=Priestia flexa TaxID=86664 RepID=UPI00248F6754|nr:ATP-binding protein [Priestia flexa]